ncbi:hypothetical protein E2C01_055410 [Portunus trituberculatus]|uniref:Uncharacterized protein n=1 Tax=Portunus trituberculatus TaxID=210409 RepID=A0A5B7GMD8_PORTR|nr:hypothetical protein [Portunus trituberculatus]
MAAIGGGCLGKAEGRGKGEALQVLAQKEPLHIRSRKSLKFVISCGHAASATSRRHPPPGAPNERLDTGDRQQSSRVTPGSTEAGVKTYSYGHQGAVASEAGSYLQLTSEGPYHNFKNNKEESIEAIHVYVMK